MRKILGLILCIGSAYATDSTEELPEWLEGKKLKILYLGEEGSREDFGKIAVCSDKSFDAYLKDTGLTEEEIADVKSLPPLSYTNLLLKDNDEPSFDSSNWILTYEGEAIALDNPQEKQVIGTWDLIYCVGVAILAPQQTLFAHMSFKDVILNNKIASFLQLIPETDRLNSRTFLVSGFYSMIFSTIYKSLRAAGFTNIFADIEPLVLIGDPKGENKAFVKGSALGVDLPSLKRKDAKQLKRVIKFIQLSHTVIQARNLIVNANTGELYSFRPRSERYLDQGILYKWDEQGKCISELPTNSLILKKSKFHPKQFIWK